MAIAFVDSAKRSSDAGSPYDTDTMDSTGASLIFTMWSYAGGASSTAPDSKSNTYTSATEAYNVSSSAWFETHYVNSATPTVGSGHTATLPAFYSAGIIAAFSGTHATPLDGENGATETGSGTSLATGSVTPSVGGCLCVTALFDDTSLGTITTPSGYTLLESPGTGLHYLQVAYKIKDAGDTTAENPSWSWTTSNTATAKIVVFKPANTQSQAPRSMHHFRMMRG